MTKQWRMAFVQHRRPRPLAQESGSRTINRLLRVLGGHDFAKAIINLL